MGDAWDGENVIRHVKHTVRRHTGEWDSHGIVEEDVLGPDGVIEGFFINVAHAIKDKLGVALISIL